MTRPLRVEFPGAFYHITTRGNARGRIFISDKDREQLLFIFGQTADKFNWRCYSYCFMGNHYHLVIQTIDPTLSRGMQHLNGNYTQWFNAKHQRVGHIFQGRFKAFLIEEHDYLMQVIRYVVLNPVRAKMVRNPCDYRWSSHRATAGLETAPEWLARKEILKQFSNDRRQAEKRYQAFVKMGFDLPSPFEQTGNSGILGSDQFVDEMRDHIKNKGKTNAFSVNERMSGRPTLEQLFDETEERKERDSAIALSLNYLEYSGAEVGRFLGLDASTVIKIARQKKFLIQDLTPSDHF